MPPRKSQLIKDWSNVLGQEWNHCDDEDYARRLYEACWPHKPFLFKTSRPHAHVVELALYSACHDHPGAKFIWERRLKYLERAKRKSTPTAKLIDKLQDHHWLQRFVARHVLLYRGGQAIASLQMLVQSSRSLQSVAQWLVDSICVETTARLQPTAAHRLCPDCLVHCGPHHIDKSFQVDPVYYGCRYCRRSYRLLPCSAGVVAVLDRNWSRRYEQHKADGQVRGNVFVQQALFDFDALEIIQATDEDVERFAVQVGNEIDPNREPRPDAIPCYIASGCQLSANTWRILESTFARVEMMS